MPDGNGQQLKVAITVPRPSRCNRPANLTTRPVSGGKPHSLVLRRSPIQVLTRPDVAKHAVHYRPAPPRLKCMSRGCSSCSSPAWSQSWNLRPWLLCPLPAWYIVRTDCELALSLDSPIQWTAKSPCDVFPSRFYCLNFALWNSKLDSVFRWGGG